MVVFMQVRAIVFRQGGVYQFTCRRHPSPGRRYARVVAAAAAAVVAVAAAVVALSTLSHRRRPLCHHTVRTRLRGHAARTCAAGGTEQLPLESSTRSDAVVPNGLGVERLIIA